MKEQIEQFQATLPEGVIVRVTQTTGGIMAADTIAQGREFEATITDTLVLADKPDHIKNSVRAWGSTLDAALDNVRFAFEDARRSGVR